MTKRNIMHRKTILAVAGVVVLLGGIGVAFAATTGQQETVDPDISKDEAIGIAEEHVGGTAQNAQVEQENGPVWEVTVEGDSGTVKEVEVDGNSGEVLEVEDEDDDGLIDDDILGDDDN